VGVTRRALTRVLATLGLTALFTTVLVGLQPASVSDALDGSAFDPGNIISDANFYDANAMSESDIQTFLQGKIGTCTNGQCLNVLKVDTVSRAVDAMCPGGYAGAAAEPISRVIFKVQQGCGISAKVILVTLQKEEGLVTSRAPSATALKIAMGYGCPDSAACDSTYFGIFNQIYQAARQFKRYGMSTTFTWFPVGSPSTIKFNPNPSVNGVPCGSSTVTIQNKATAALYYYTPYQPNAPALANLRGSGDGCSTYGNRNFWVYYNDWFGPPSYPPGSPEGEVYSVAVSPRSIRITGWVVDPSVPTYSVPVAIQVAGSWFSTTASNADTTGTTQVAGAGPNHGFDLEIPWTPGVSRVCVTFINFGAGSNVSLSCTFATVPDYPSAMGAVESATATPGSVALVGWAVRPDAPTGSVNVAAQVGSKWFQLTSGQPDAVAPTKVTGAGPNQGFSGSLALPSGTQNICIWATSSGGVSSQIACTTVIVPTVPAPVGGIETAVAGAGTIAITGWAVRPDAPTGAVNVAAQIGNSWYQLTSGQPDSVAPGEVVGAGPNQGYKGTISTTPGVKTLCIWAASSAGVGMQLGCTSVMVGKAPAPLGAIESATAAPGTITLNGWALRPDAPTGSTNVAAQVGNSWFQLTSGQADAVAPTVFSGAGPNQGFSGTINVGPGSQKVCIWVSSSAGVGVQVTCSTVDVPSGPTPVGAIESIEGGVGTVSVTGWALRPDAPTGATIVAANVGDHWYQLASGTPDSVAPSAFAGAGPNQGFTGTFAASSGVKNVCIWVASSAGVGVQVVCSTVTVR